MPSDKPQIRITELHRKALYNEGASLGRTASKQLEVILNQYFAYKSKVLPQTTPFKLPPILSAPQITEQRKYSNEQLEKYISHLDIPSDATDADKEWWRKNCD